MKRLRYFSILVFLSFISSALTACQLIASTFECTDAIGCIDIGPNDPIKIGVLQAQSGGAAILGSTQLQTIELAIAQRNKQLLNHPITLQIEDSKCLAEGGTIATMKIVADPQIIAILGPSCSGAATTASKIMSEAGLVMIAGSNTAPTLTSIGGEKGQDWHPGYFRTSPNGVWMGRAAAAFAYQELGITKAATINDGDAYTRGLTNAFNQTFTQLGGDIVLDTAIDKTDNNMHPVLQSVAIAKAQLLFFPLFQPEGDAIVLGTQEIIGLKNVALLTSVSLLTDDFVKNVNEAGVGMFFVNDATTQSSAIAELHTDYVSMHGELPQHLTYIRGYDASKA